MISSILFLKSQSQLPQSVSPKLMSSQHLRMISARGRTRLLPHCRLRQLTSPRPLFWSPFLHGNNFNSQRDTESQDVTTKIDSLAKASCKICFKQVHDLHLDHYGYRLRAHKFQIVLEMDVTQLTKDFNLMRIRCTLSSKIFSCPKNIGWIAILTTITFWVNKKMFFFTQNKDWKSKPFSMLSQTFIHKRFHIMHISPTSFYIEKTYCKYHWKIDVKLGYFATTL